MHITHHYAEGIYYWAWIDFYPLRRDYDMNWQILLAISLTCYSIALLLQRVTLKDDRSDPIMFSIMIPLVAGLILGMYSLFNGFHVSSFLTFLPNFILMIVLYAASNILSYHALKCTEASTFTILNSSRACWSIAAAILFLREDFDIRQVIGTTLVIFSVILVSWNGRKIILGKGEIFTLLAAFAFGVEFVNDAYLLQHFDINFYLPVAFILPSLVVWMCYPRATSQIKGLFESRVIWTVLIIGALYAVSAATIFLAYQYGRNAAQIAPINETSIILIVILAAIFLKERSFLVRKIIAAMISFLGVLLIK